MGTIGYTAVVNVSIIRILWADNDLHIFVSIDLNIWPFDLGSQLLVIRYCAIGMYAQGSFPALPEIILTAGTAFKPALFELDKKHPVYGTPNLPILESKSNFVFASHRPSLLILDPPLFGSHDPVYKHDIALYFPFYSILFYSNRKLNFLWPVSLELTETKGQMNGLQRCCGLL